MHLRLHRMYTDVLDIQTGDHAMDPIQFLLSDHPDPIFIMDKVTGRITRTNQESDFDRMEQIQTGRMLNELVWFCEDNPGTPYAFYDGQWYQSQKMEVMLDGTEQLIVILNRRTDIPDHDSLTILNQMTATLLHRLRSPMNGAQGYLELIGEELTSANARRRYNNIHHGLNQAFDIMDELELMNQIPASRVADEDTSIRANPEKIVQDLRFQVSEEEAKRIRYISKADYSEILCDPNTLRVILAELIRNGLEHSGRGNILVELVSHNTLRVTNGGDPIPGELAGKIFYPFMTDKVNNLGIGLTRAYLLALSQRGTLMLSENSRETGITFTFRLPPPGW